MRSCAWPAGRSARQEARDPQRYNEPAIPTASADLLLLRMRTKVDDLCRERGKNCGPLDPFWIGDLGRGPAAALVGRIPERRLSRLAGVLLFATT